MSKKALRKKTKTRRAAVPQKTRAFFQKKALIYFSHMRLIYPQAKIWAGYHALQDEADINHLRDFCTQHDLTYALPIVPEDGGMVFQIIDDKTVFQTSPWGFLEPVYDASKTIMPDIFFIPGLSFDEKGHRLGYGQGHYDRYFAGLDQDVYVRIGVTFEDLMHDEPLPAESHDITMHYVITEKKVYKIS